METRLNESNVYLREVIAKTFKDGKSFEGMITQLANQPRVLTVRCYIESTSETLPCANSPGYVIDKY